MFTAYFDASGNERETVLTIAGFVSRLNKWERFEKQWKALLPPTVSMFHMTDFVSSQNGWEDWKGETKRRATLIQKLAACIKQNTNKGFAASLLMKDFKECNRRYKLKESFRPYTFVGAACLGQLRKWARNKNVDWRKILCIFEDGDEGQGDLIAHARKEGFNAIPQSKADIRAFDPCDLAAWKSRRLIDASQVKETWRQDPEAAGNYLRSLGQLDPLIQDNGLLRSKGLEAACRAFNIAER